MLNFNDFGRKWQLPAILMFGTFPLPLIFCAEFFWDRVPMCIAIAVVYWLLACFCILVKGKLRVIAGIAGCAAIAAMSAALLPVKEEAASLVIPAMYIVLLLGGLRIGGWAHGQELHPAPMLISLTAHVIGYAMVKLRMEMAHYDAVEMPMLIAFLGYAAMLLLSMNRISLNYATNDSGRAPQTMRRKNTLLVLGMFLLTLFLAALPAVIEAAKKLWQGLLALILIVVNWLLKLFPEEMATGGEGSSMPEFGAMEQGEESLLSMILEKIVIVLTLIAIAILAVILIRALWKKLKVLLKHIWASLNAYLATSSEDYVDEIADTRDGTESEPLLHRIRRRARMKRVDESALSPGERIRYRYKLQGLKHPEWRIDSTARENLDIPSAEIYERARYSTQEMTARDADTFAERLN